MSSGRNPAWQLMLSLGLVLLCQLVTGPAHEWLHAGAAHVEHGGQDSDGCVHLSPAHDHDDGLHEQHHCLTCTSGRSNLLVLDAAPTAFALSRLAGECAPTLLDQADTSAVLGGVLGARGPPVSTA